LSRIPTFTGRLRSATGAETRPSDDRPENQAGWVVVPEPVRLITRGFVLDERAARAVRRALGRLGADAGGPGSDPKLVLAREPSGRFRAHLEASRAGDGRVVRDAWAPTPASAAVQVVRAASRGTTKR
jgi:hypothetical protein